MVGRASRLDADARRPVSVVPGRVRTSLLDVVLPGWPALAEEPERRQLLDVDASRVRFRHELARHAIAASVPAAVRRGLHAEILAALLAVDADPADIVHHAEAAGAEEVVAEHALVAARRAAALDSNREAISHEVRAQDFLGRLPRTEQLSCSRSWRRRPTSSTGSSWPSPQSGARSRSARASATGQAWVAARACCRSSTGSPATASVRG